MSFMKISLHVGAVKLDNVTDFAFVFVLFFEYICSHLQQLTTALQRPGFDFYDILSILCHNSTYSKLKQALTTYNVFPLFQ